jgi:hypothetical protein
MKLFIGILLIIVSGCMITTCAVKKVHFKQECSGHLKRAADAGTIGLAKQEMKSALTFIEGRKLTSGYTSVFYNTPDEDLGFWYQNLKSSAQLLDSIAPNASQLEVSNTLMKLRETILDNSGDSGQHVTCPAGIIYHPDNLMWAFLRVFMVVFIVVGFFMILAHFELLDEFLNS